MKKFPLLMVIMAAVLAGCFPEGEGKDKLIDTSPQMGQAGGERLEESAPLAPGPGDPAPQTASAFPVAH